MCQECKATAESLQDFYKMRIKQIKREIDDLDDLSLRLAEQAAYDSYTRMVIAAQDERVRQLKMKYGNGDRARSNEIRAKCLGLQPGQRAPIEYATAFPIHRPRLVPY